MDDTSLLASIVDTRTRNDAYQTTHAGSEPGRNHDGGSLCNLQQLQELGNDN